MRERGVSFKQALNDTIREGALPRRRPRPFHTEPARMGIPGINLDRAVQMAADLEDDEIIRKMRTGK
jgi:hypothetical protein